MQLNPGIYTFSLVSIMTGWLRTPCPQFVLNFIHSVQHKQPCIEEMQITFAVDVTYKIIHKYGQNFP